MTKIKVCGAQTLTDAKAVEEAGADFVGFVFAPSKRQVTPKQVSKIVKELKAIQTVGVFVDPTKEELNEILAEVSLDYIQLHGDESQELAKQFSGKVIKAFPSNSSLAYSELFNYPAEYILMDSPRKEHYGGSGIAFDWEQLNDPHIDKSKFILAGGLTPENVKEAIRTVHPMAIDISSGVETNGVKDPDKINQLITKVRSL